jgi:hypothetical protein
MKTEPANEQEISQWLMNRVLPVQFIEHYGDGKSCEAFIYSPDGLFAIIKALDLNSREVAREATKVGPIVFEWKYFLFNQDYNAFYNAVWQALEGK